MIKPGKYVRQGDVVITSVAEVPKGKRKDAMEEFRGARKAVLAHGEVTGHAHQISEGEVSYFTVETSENMFEKFLEVHSDVAKLTHEEHHAFELPKGIYKIEIEQEYFPEEIRDVAD